MTPEREKEIRLLVEFWPTYGDEGHQAVVDLLAEVERLRAENTAARVVNAELYKIEDNYRAKLAKAREALREIAIAADFHVARGIARQTLKEIGE